jgi:hypothetical protein
MRPLPSLRLVAALLLAGCLNLSKLRQAPSDAGMDAGGPCPLPEGTNLLMSNESTFDDSGGWTATGTMLETVPAPAGCVGAAGRLCTTHPDMGYSNAGVGFNSQHVSFNESAQATVWVKQAVPNSAALIFFWEGPGGVWAIDRKQTDVVDQWVPLHASVAAPTPDSGVYILYLQVGLNEVLQAPCVDLDQAFVGQP